MQIIYLTLEQAMETHSKTVAISGGGSQGVLDTGRLESVLFHIQNDGYYPTFEAKLTHLFFSVNKFHCFQDGNKRIAISLSAQMLLLNGYLFCVNRFIREMENISRHVAAGLIDKELLQDIVHAVLYDEMDTDESLKLRIIEATREENIP
jgi:death on curing protein